MTEPNQMPFIPATEAQIFEIPGVRFSALAAPSRGATENAVWIVTLQPGAPGMPHSLTREEIFVAIGGAASAIVDGAPHELNEGSALVVPAGAVLSLSNPHAAPFRAVVVLPVGGQARIDGEAPFTPPWAQ